MTCEFRFLCTQNYAVINKEVIPRLRELDPVAWGSQDEESLKPKTHLFDNEMNVAMYLGYSHLREEHKPHRRWRSIFPDRGPTPVPPRQMRLFDVPLLQTVHGLHEDLGLPVDEAHVLDDLVLRVEQLDALRVRVVARSEGARVRSGEFPGKRRPF